MWKKAMDEKMEAHGKNKTWTLTTCPPGSRILSNKWAFKIKTKADGTTDRYKPRIVTKGYQQRRGVNFHETFSPVAKYNTIRAVLAMAAAEKLKLRQFDVKTAFLNG
ncbi:retrovirus-related pol polyprotein from transposon tnt 1-94 [Lasius niger]|uniref:Retrovirus-related pol polyprotein from transposon tnt 1-94 n=1 Tax=Lasius niger TaxID=67767 RepID=A0A0J7K3D1_LASNI|nr:retrovirus-related pol polyprotein from transposon tnt 1-94 [Lasius niger]